MKRISDNSKRLIIWMLVAVLMTAGLVNVKADEGMWIPMLIERYNIDKMHEAGLRLSAEDIYSVNQDCLKDALVIFGRGCTGEMISDEGLLLTNHHCGYGSIQRHSSVENDYLTNGFWAMNRDEELPNEGLTVTYLRYMKDVSAEMGEGITGGMDPDEVQREMELNMGELIEAATSGTHYNAVVRPFYYGNAYYLFVYETFTDVRLVGAPPEAIGNFGADQDNWMWPRHNGDFSMFRVYANEDNEPADYDPSNRPYHPRKHLEIDTGGIQEGDFTMVLGYPGSTTEYLYSEAVRSMLENSLPMMIGLRTTRLEIMDRYMRRNDTIRIQYASTYRGVSNAWKKWQGIILGLTRNDAVELKIQEEEQFRNWVESDGERILKYDGILDEFARLYNEIGPYEMAMNMMNESVMTIELFRQASRISRMMWQGASRESIERQMERFNQNFHRPLDQEICAAMLEAYFKQMPETFAPACGKEINGRYKGDYSRYTEALYDKSVFNRPDKFRKVLDRYEKDAPGAIRILERDPVLITVNQFTDLMMEEAAPVYSRLQDLLDRNYKKYMAALLEKEQDHVLYPDANFTMRLTYGKVDGYKPEDAVEYRYYTTLSGVMEKSMEGFEDYAVPDRLRELYEARDYGRYGVNGTMPVCFLASNHTSGGNSGSPVMDADGRLIGINFDRNWEGTMSDVYYDPSLCRNISVDIRYILFLIDKFAGAGYLLDEMDIVW
jgi:hypothetical protein